MNRSCGESCAKNESMEIVTATPDRYAAIADLNRTAFGSDAEGALIARLRDEGLVLVERVALDADGLVGHILFSRLDVEIDGRKVSSAALAPMAVRPDRHRQGIGSRLVQDGLAELRSVGCEAVIVLGHPGIIRVLASQPPLQRSSMLRLRARPSWRSHSCRGLSTGTQGQ